MKPRRIFSALLLSLGLILLTFAATCRLVMTNIQIDYDPSNPVTVIHTSYINFAMNGVYYSYSLDNNPFFPFHYLKTPIDPKSETYSGDACVEESSKSWFTDPLIGFGCPDSEIESAAGAILSLLLAAPLSTIRHDTKRTRIPNTYDDGYHFETIPVKERRLKIDF